MSGSVRATKRKIHCELGVYFDRLTIQKMRFVDPLAYRCYFFWKQYLRENRRILGVGISRQREHRDSAQTSQPESRLLVIVQQAQHVVPLKLVPPLQKIQLNRKPQPGYLPAELPYQLYRSLHRSTGRQ